MNGSKFIVGCECQQLFGFPESSKPSVCRGTPLIKNYDSACVGRHCRGLFPVRQQKFPLGYAPSPVLAARPITKVILQPEPAMDVLGLLREEKNKP